MPTPSRRTNTHRPRGRQAEAEANDARLLSAARAVFAELGCDAPVSVIAKRAGVGMGSLYRRYPTKDDLARHVQVDGLDRWTALAGEALDNPDPWQALVLALRAALTQGGDVSMLPVIGGRFASSPEVDAASARLELALDALVRRAVAEGALRPDVTLADLVLLLQILGSRLPGPPERVDQLRARYLDLTLSALRAPATTPLTGPAPQWPELLSLWNVREDDA